MHFCGNFTFKMEDNAFTLMKDLMLKAYEKKKMKHEIGNNFCK